MIEIAISLAIIGIALVAIIGVLPYGMNAQRANREQTVINQDATVFLEAIRNGAGGGADLTNYVYAITNEDYPGNGPNINFTNNAEIIGLLSTPSYPTQGITNRMVAYVHSISGPAVEKPPQDNPILRQDSFSYWILCTLAPVQTDTNFLNEPYYRQLTANLHELRLTFLWPQEPNGRLAPFPSRQTYRLLVGGQISQTNYNRLGQTLYFFQPQDFTVVTNAP